jgi:hypothetical protein
MMASPRSTIDEASYSETAAERRTGGQDYRGLFYRIIAPGPDLAVLEIGAPFVSNWFSNVVTGDLRSLQRALPVGPRFALVILHSTLGGCTSIAEAFAAAHSVLEPGGIVALAGVNRIRGSVARNSDTTVPRASASGYRRAAMQAGFTQVDLYVVQPDIDEPAYAVSMAPASARAFFRHELMARKTSGRNRLPIARAVLAELNLAPYLQPFLVVVGTK